MDIIILYVLCEIYDGSNKNISSYSYSNTFALMRLRAEISEDLGAIKRDTFEGIVDGERG